jgi:3-hydroxyacyl-[acyl-carrier-protein] dehydratase
MAEPGPDPRAVLPHGPEMVLVDRAALVPAGELPGEPGALPSGEVELHATRTVRANEPCYRLLSPGQDPAGRAYPSSLVMESFGQAAALLWAVRAGRLAGPDEVLMFAAARDCRLEGHAYPGDVLRHRVRLDDVVAGTAFASGDTWVGDRRIAVWGRFTAVVRPATVLPPTDLAESGADPC